MNSKFWSWVKSKPYIGFVGGGRVCAVRKATETLAAEMDLIETLQPYVGDVVSSLNGLPEERREILDEMVGFITERVRAGEPVDLTFLCTHNSRRSLLGQAWAQTAAVHYDIPGVTAYSGGTETTACNPRTVRALRRAGFSVVQSNSEDNPHYLIQYSEARRPIEAYSKLYDAEGNPAAGFLAAMCCADADANCPVVHGASARIRLCYEDPKVADDTSEETARYDERCRQIAIEMFYVMSRVRESL